jgi:hypothetical protein
MGIVMGGETACYGELKPMFDWQFNGSPSSRHNPHDRMLAGQQWPIVGIGQSLMALAVAFLWGRRVSKDTPRAERVLNGY